MRLTGTTWGLLAANLISTIACSASESEIHTVKADVWADNWFALYVGQELVKEDSVPFNTERSFNSDSFTFDATFPIQINFVIKDFKQDDSGLEYIGTNRQQMGDGGFSAQFFDTETNELIAVSNSDWRCLAIHRAPLNRSCERSDNPLADCRSDIRAEPRNWKMPDFDDSHWPNAVVHPAAEVRPRRGYLDVSWQPGASLIWTEDIVIDNTILCRATIPAPN